MKCISPMPAGRVGDELKLYPPRGWGESLTLPCGKCFNCKMKDRLGWALRGRFEAAEHEHNSFITLTFDDAHYKPGLALDDLQLFYKRLRRYLDRQGRKLRHLSCGEYGDKNGRPHYHGVLFGFNHEKDRDLVERAWQHQGRTQCVRADVGAIHYVVGYTLKKASDPEHQYWWGEYQELDRETGELTTGRKKNYYLPPPFRTMSKNPGIGAAAKKWRDSWRLHATLDGKKMPVPRFLQNHWKATATKEEIEEREMEVRQLQLQQHRARTTEATREKNYLQALEDYERELKDAELLAEARIRALSAKRHL